MNESETALQVELRGVSELTLLDVAQVLLWNEGHWGRAGTPITDVLDLFLIAVRRELISRWRGEATAEVPVEIKLSDFTPWWRAELRKVFALLAGGYQARASAEPRYARHDEEGFRLMNGLAGSLAEVQSPATVN